MNWWKTRRGNWSGTHSYVRGQGYEKLKVWKTPQNWDPDQGAWWEIRGYSSSLDISEGYRGASSGSIASTATDCLWKSEEPLLRWYSTTGTEVDREEQVPLLPSPSLSSAPYLQSLTEHQLAKVCKIPSPAWQSTVLSSLLVTSHR